MEYLEKNKDERIEFSEDDFRLFFDESEYKATKVSDDLDLMTLTNSELIDIIESIDEERVTYINMIQELMENDYEMNHYVSELEEVVDHSRDHLILRENNSLEYQKEIRRYKKENKKLSIFVYFSFGIILGLVITIIVLSLI